MPKIKHHTTGHEQTVTSKQLEVILANPLTKNLYQVSDVKEPDELKKADKKAKEKKEKEPEVIAPEEPTAEQTSEQ